MTPPGPSRPHATRLLHSAADGVPGAADELLPLVYDELHRLAQRLMRTEPPGHTLQATALVHEAFLRLADEDARDWATERQFLRVAARAMRRVLVDAARARRADKRGGERLRVTWTDELARDGDAATDVLEVDAALAQLAKGDPQLAEVVELKFFGGLEFKDIADMMDIPLRTIERRWRFGKAWLARQITELRQRSEDD